MNHLLACLVKSGVRVSPLGLVEMTCPAITLEFSLLHRWPVLNHDFLKERSPYG